MALTTIKDDDVDLPGDHAWHYRYNRRLSFFSHSVGRLIFSQDGQWLVSATSSGTLKIFDTGIWAEAAKLEGCRSEEPRVLAISPSQRWLVVVFPSVMHVFQCSPPWRLEQKLSAPVDPATKAPSEWVCIAFSPDLEVNHARGVAGQDNHLAAFAHGTYKALCVLDYSGGWTDTPMQTRRSFDNTRATSIAYTACGTWLVLGYESGQLQVWNHFSLTLEKTLPGHSGGHVACITSSPRCAPYDCRVVSCGGDCSLRVWHSDVWLLEQIAPDTKADRNGIRSCIFSSKGDWVVSVALEMCVWRVCVSRKGRLELRLHQRLTAICGAEGICAAAMCSHRDEIAMGSREGSLGLWAKISGWPKELAHADEAHNLEVKKESAIVTPWIMDKPLHRPMMMLRPDGCKNATSNGEKRPFRGSDWIMRTNLRSLMDVTPVLLPSGRRLAAPGELMALGRHREVTNERTSSMTAVTPSSPVSPVRTKLPTTIVQKVAAFGSGTAKDLLRSSSMPEMSRWRPPSTSHFEFETNATVGSSASQSLLDSQKAFLRSAGQKPVFEAYCGSSTKGSRLDGELPRLVANETSPVRAAMLHATKGLVQRISLDPHKIC